MEDVHGKIGDLQAALAASEAARRAAEAMVTHLKLPVTILSHKAASSGRLQQNGFVESFNGRLRDECLNETLFTSLTHARQILADWREDYNTVRPHSQLDGRTPDQVARQASRGHAPETLVIPSTPNHKNRKLSF
ncbi:transposase [Komagataeibacter sp. FXV3]|uniref:integrase core domain-containing protein n=1 Tax=Komagataeibacter sp. FXV3 TaxID=2608998 RepID=UPI0038D1B7D8